MHFTVEITPKPYEVWIEDTILQQLGNHLHKVNAHRWAIVMDETVTNLYGSVIYSVLINAKVEFQILTIPSGEKQKNLSNYQLLCHTLISKGFSRTDGILAVGGGVIGDLAGFVAATLFRGMQLVQMPTTLLSQVDSCIGGKVGINLPEGKNLIGAIYQPNMVLVDPSFLKTLSKREYSCGMAEVIKYGFIRDPNILNRLEQDTVDMKQLVFDCLSIKKCVVEQDPEDTSFRHILNFGHTYGHAYEQQEEYQSLSHGEAVAAGMAEMLRWEIQHGFDVSKEAARLQRILEKYNLPNQIVLKDKNILKKDKKHSGDEITIAIIEKEGKATIKKIKVSAL